MSWRTNALMLRARDIGRSLGVNSYLARLVQDKAYEARFETAVISALRPGDVIWDIGANVGLYSVKFAERVGPDGQVVAFEPSPVNFERMRAAIAGHGNITGHNLGLGEVSATMAFQQGSDDLGATSRVIEAGPENGITVHIRTGAQLIDDHVAPAPTILKIDVEGYEGEVLAGFGDKLGCASLRMIAVEVHFGILRDRGLADAPRAIEALLVGHGYTLSWPDSSHLVATRVA